MQDRMGIEQLCAFLSLDWGGEKEVSGDFKNIESS
jgi:hypothetical protein